MYFHLAAITPRGTVQLIGRRPPSPRSAPGGMEKANRLAELARRIGTTRCHRCKQAHPIAVIAVEKHTTSRLNGPAPSSYRIAEQSRTSIALLPLLALLNVRP